MQHVAINDNNNDNKGGLELARSLGQAFALDQDARPSENDLVLGRLVLLLHPLLHLVVLCAGLKTGESVLGFANL